MRSILDEGRALFENILIFDQNVVKSLWITYVQLSILSRLVLVSIGTHTI